MTSLFSPQDCHLQENSREYYRDKGQLRDDVNYDIYQPLTVDTTPQLMSTTEGSIDLLEKLSVGCYADDADDRDLSFHMFTSGSDMTIEKCQSACRQQAFKYAGLQVRRLAHCGLMQPIFSNAFCLNTIFIFVQVQNFS